VATRELGDQQGGRAGIDGELSLERVRRDRLHRPSEVIVAHRRERVLHPAARVADDDRDRAERGFGVVEQLCRRGGIGEVRFTASAWPPAARNVSSTHVASLARCCA